ncbi:MAG TPA: hypothetical protein PLH33_08345, partial [Chitinophagaceae bacterium]|nr:hypothetical protein [Chitinophagaceae bacterium]
NNYTNFVGALQKDGLLQSKASLSYENGIITINGKVVDAEIAKKYIALLKDNKSDIKMNFNIE